jgi:hypothetical protein
MSSFPKFISIPFIYSFIVLFYFDFNNGPISSGRLLFNVARFLGDDANSTFSAINCGDC